MVSGVLTLQIYHTSPLSFAVLPLLNGPSGTLCLSVGGGVPISRRRLILTDRGRIPSHKHNPSAFELDCCLRLRTSTTLLPVSHRLRTVLLEWWWLLTHSRLPTRLSPRWLLPRPRGPFPSLGLAHASEFLSVRLRHGSVDRHKHPARADFRLA